MPAMDYGQTAGVIPVARLLCACANLVKAGTQDGCDSGNSFQPGWGFEMETGGIQRIHADGITLAADRFLFHSLYNAGH
jgi:hypothetical protein